MSDVAKYFLHDGLRTGMFELNVATGEIVNGKFSFMGSETVRSDSTTLGNTGTYTVLDTTSTEIFNATANVGELLKDGAALTTAVTSIQLNGDGKLREQRAVGERFPAGIGYGRFNLTGKMVAYFQNFDFYTNFLNHETVSVSFNFEDVDNNSYYFTMPAVKITSDPVSPTGIDTDIMEEMEFVAQRDPSLRTMMMIDRFSSVWPFSDAT